VAALFVMKKPMLEKYFQAISAEADAGFTVDRQVTFSRVNQSSLCVTFSFHATL
jgi:hypothetical protein